MASFISGMRDQFNSAYTSLMGTVPAELTPSEKTANMLMTGAAAVVLGYVATKAVAAATSVAFAIIFAVAAYKLCTDEKYQGKDILANVKLLTSDTYALLKGLFDRAMAATGST